MTQSTQESVLSSTLRFISCLIVSGLLPISTYASLNTCEESETEIGRIKMQSKVTIACGYKKEKQVVISSVLLIEDKQTKKIFEADEAFKSYTFRKNENSFIIQESLNRKEPLPFLEIQILCKKNDCKKIVKCIWKKQKPDENLVAKIADKSKKQSVSISDTDIDSLFVAALNGSIHAQKIFTEDRDLSNVSSAEAFETYKLDISRLKKASCF